ncbi:MAG: hypothetical protein IJP61_12780 [Treponema sp.]|nr:hypothetical protein [Treponema sp.]
MNDKIKLEKEEAKKHIKAWLEEAEEKAADLWNKDQEQVKLYFKDNDERKSIGIIPENAMTIFDGIDDYHLYADKSYLIDHYLNRHYDNRLFENIQNILDNYTNIYFDSVQNSIGFIKKNNNLVDCLFVKVIDSKLVLFASTYKQPEIRLQNKRYKKITPAKVQEQ